MKVKSVYLFVLSLSLMMAISGLYFLVNSAALGFKSAENFLWKRGGSGMDTSQFNVLIGSSIEAYKWLGVVLLSSGIVFAITTFLKNDFVSAFGQRQE